MIPNRIIARYLIGLLLVVSSAGQAGVLRSFLCRFGLMADHSASVAVQIKKPVRGESGVSKSDLRKMIKGGDKGDIHDTVASVRNAVKAVLLVNGTTADLADRRAALMFDLFSELKEATGSGWNFFYYRLPDGSHAFRAPGHPVVLIVRSMDGVLYKTTPPEGDIEKWRPDYEDPAFKKMLLPDPPKP